MTCTDCHATNTADKNGPHGSSIKWMLKGANKAWPYTTAANNGTSGTTNFRTLSNRSTNSGTDNGLFCLNCHPSTNANNVHGKGSHSYRSCVECHIRVPHGGKVARLMNATGTATSNLPARYWPNGSGTGTIPQLKYFKKATSPTGYGQTTNCSDNGCYGGEHNFQDASSQNW